MGHLSGSLCRAFSKSVVGQPHDGPRVPPDLQSTRRKKKSTQYSKSGVKRGGREFSNSNQRPESSTLQTAVPFGPTYRKRAWACLGLTMCRPAQCQPPSSPSLAVGKGKGRGHTDQAPGSEPELLESRLWAGSGERARGEGVRTDLQEASTGILGVAFTGFAEEAPDGLLSVIGVHCHVSAELFRRLRQPVNVVQREAPLPKVGLLPRVQVQRRVESRNGPLHVPPFEGLHASSGFFDRRPLPVLP